MMWAPAIGSDPRLDEMMAWLTRVRAELRDIQKHLEYLDAEAWDHHKRLENPRGH